MADLYATLLAYAIPVLPGQLLTATRLNAPLAALRAVVELHGPFVSPSQPGRAPDFCRHCGTAEGWPCSTIQAIARELGVPEGDDHRG